MRVKIKRLHEKAVMPQYAKEGDAGVDLTITEIEERNEFYEVKFGLSVEIPQGYFGMLVSRSGVTKMNHMLKNGVGIIDSGYRGELVARFKKVKFEDGTVEKFYQVGERGAQLLIIPYPQIIFQEVEELSETERGDSGFGSSGK